MAGSGSRRRQRGEARGHAGKKKDAVNIQMMQGRGKEGRTSTSATEGETHIAEFYGKRRRHFSLFFPLFGSNIWSLERESTVGLDFSNRNGRWLELSGLTPCRWELSEKLHHHSRFADGA
eukprot:271302-Hanusia_phi.AAC.3